MSALINQFIDQVIDTVNFPVQDYFVLDGNKSPGRCTIKGAATPRKWAKHVGYGSSGAWLVFMGTDLSAFEIDVFLWDRATHPQAWDAFATCLVKPQPGKPALALTIEHPILVYKPLDITQVVVLDVSQPEQDDTGGWTITIKFQQYRAPVAVAVKNADTPDVPNAPPKPADAGEQQIAALAAQRDALSSGADKSGLF